MADHAPIRAALAREADRLSEDSLQSAKSYLIAGTWWSGYNTWIGAPAEVLTTILAGSAGISAIAGQDAKITAGLALVAAGFSAVRGFFKPAEKAEAFALKGARYAAIRSEARMFRDIDLIADQSDTDLQAKLTDLWQRYNGINEMAPVAIARFHQRAAKHSIEAGEADYAVDRQQSGASQ